MKYLCLAYGAESDWHALSKDQQDQLLSQDEEIRRGGALMAAVEATVTTVRAWDGRPIVTHESVAGLPAPLAGFSVIEASSIAEVIALVCNTPCARAKGAIEIRPIMFINDEAWRTDRSPGAEKP
jgi:hypothetical protein